MAERGKTSMTEKNHLMTFCSGIQHIGIPTADMEKTCCFYKDLGFELIYETVVNETQKVAFFKYANVVIEAYGADEVRSTGAIDHISIDCVDIEGAYRFSCDQGYRIVSDGIESLGFWENGIQFFIIEGPNHERIEIDQRL